MTGVKDRKGNKARHIFSLQMPPRKGKQVRFVAGKYGGKDGWIDASKEEGDDTVPVIVNLGKKGEKATFVYKSSIEYEMHGLPSSYAEAVLQQCPDLERKLVDFCRDLAKCDIQRDPAGILNIFSRRTLSGVSINILEGCKV